MGRHAELLILVDSDRDLLEMCNKGVYQSRELKRAEILLKGDDGYSVNEIAEQVGRHPNTVRNVRKRYIEEGLESALHDRTRSGKPRKIFTEQTALITTITCSDPPPGYANWTIRMIADKFVELSEVDKISPETIRKVLKKTNSNPGRKGNGALAK